ncbi:threonine synthase [Halomicrobium katesii]|uniref:threonine synthase n=1 Tax=Halomicrobium katesii TaxID=437163 RepID=UPI0009B5AD3A|nr:threonine synthase [Halomicrobium katesii]
MNPTIALECIDCGRVFVPADERLVCPDHDGVGGILDVQYDQSGAREAVAAGVGEGIDDLWKYALLLPTDGHAVDLGAGGTPLLDAPTLSRELGVTVRLKDERGNPTGSIKDRASAVLTSRALAGDESVLTCASTGNAAASLAGYAARTGLDCCIFVPADVPEGKAVQPLVYGADVYAVDGDYDDAFSLCRRVAANREWYDCSAAVNPYAVEGLRTVGHELAEQSRASVPDWIVYPMGNGCGLAATWKGFREFAELGIVEECPRLLGVQAEGATAIHDRFTGERARAGGETQADSIDVGHPHNAQKACRALEDSGGATVVVSDREILDAERTLGRTEGIYAEPASAATLAGLESAVDTGIVAPGDSATLVVTGTGLKDTASARDLVDGVDRVPDTPAAVPDPE